MIRPVTVHDARDIAQVVLGDNPRRWRHTIGVARRAEQLAVLAGPGDRDILLAAAWLHDIGHAEELVDTGFPPVDGARFLDRHRWPARISALVAHHSGASFIATARGLADALAPYPAEMTVVSDLLAYSDQTVGPDGQPMSVDDRLADMLHRHGPDSPNARAHRLRAPYLRAVAERVARMPRQDHPRGPEAATGRAALPV